MNPHAMGCQLLGEHQCSCGWSQRDYERELMEQGGMKKAAAQIADWMEGLARHVACPPERRDWYLGVAMDIRHEGSWRADAEYRRKQ